MIPYETPYLNPRPPEETRHKLGRKIIEKLIPPSEAAKLQESYDNHFAGISAVDLTKLRDESKFTDSETGEIDIVARRQYNEIPDHPTRTDAEDLDAMSQLKSAHQFDASVGYARGNLRHEHPALHDDPKTAETPTGAYPPSAEGLRHMDTYVDRRKESEKVTHDNIDLGALESETLTVQNLNQILEEVPDQRLSPKQ